MLKGLLLFIVSLNVSTATVLSFSHCRVMPKAVESVKRRSDDPYAYSLIPSTGRRHSISIQGDHGSLIFSRESVIRRASSPGDA